MFHFFAKQQATFSSTVTTHNTSIANDPMTKLSNRTKTSCDVCNPSFHMQISTFYKQSSTSAEYQ